MADNTNKIGKVVVDRNLCIGAASCIVTAGGVFELDGENKAVIKQKGGIKSSGPVTGDDLEDSSIDAETLLMAAQSCPTKAIFVFDGEGKQLYP